MYLHEFQAKNILKQYGICVPKSYLLNNLNDINNLITFFENNDLVLKAQIHSGSRFKNGGIFFVKKTYDDLYKFLSKLLNTEIFTEQTNFEKKIVNEILIEEKVNFCNEFYISLYIDRNSENLIFLISFSGGSNIEKKNKKNFLIINIDLMIKLCDYQVREILYFLKLDNTYFFQLKDFLLKLLNIFLTNDLLLIEINPLVIVNKKFVCLDAKMEFDSNAFYRNENIFKLYDYRQENLLESESKKYKLNYILLDGDIACMVNGAGLAMATMDLIKFNGGKAANFLDIGGDASKEKIHHSLRIILLNTKIKSIFINIFGGIIKCDSITSALIENFIFFDIKIPTVIRLVGNNSNIAIEMIRKSKLNIITENDFSTSIKKIIKYSRGC